MCLAASSKSGLLLLSSSSKCRLTKIQLWVLCLPGHERSLKVAGLSRLAIDSL